MQKKLIAVAVAGALGVPAVALAQTSTVTISGRMYLEYGYVNQGAGNTGTNRTNVDMLQTPGSNISFQGEEKLGGNLSAWFKCESTADPRGINQDGFCGRNSAVGFKGGFGNVYLGVWDTPFKKVQDPVGGGDTGFFGTAQLLAGQSTTVTDGASAGVFKRRQRNSINYDSPNMSGFTVHASTTSVNSSTSVTQSAPNAKPRVLSLAARYANGPLNVYGAYENHDKFYAHGGDESGWLLGASYTFAGKVKFGGLYTRQKWDDTAATSGKVSAWHLGVDWKLGGPHGIKIAYTKAGDVKGNSGAIGTNRPAAVVGGSTGAYMIQARYTHALSKRTEVAVGINRLKNDTFAAYNIYGLTNGVAFGAKHTAYAMTIDHRF